MEIPYRRTPVMGWASWNCFRTNISEEGIKGQIDALKALGLDRYGYTLVSMDDGFFGGRDPEGALCFHRERFPKGIKGIADYAHQNGLLVGIYSDGGDCTCGHYYDGEGENGSGAGLYGHEEQDLALLLEEYGFDFIKVDWCGGLRLGLKEQEQYQRIGDIIGQIRKRTGRCIIYNICRWHFPGEWAPAIADSWRIGADITPDFTSVLRQVDQAKPLRKFCSPGHVNDLDLLQLGNGMSAEEEQTHFAMWCMMSSPLVIGCDLTGISESTLAVLKNRELIAVNQDPACSQAYVIKEYREPGDGKQKLRGEIWVKELAGEQEKAVAFLNRSEGELEMEFNCSEAGLRGPILAVRDLCRHCEMTCTDRIKRTVPPHGTAVFRIRSTYTVLAQDCNAALEYREPDRAKRISPEEAKALQEKGALLLDVRSEAEYEKSHFPGAVSMPYTEIHAGIVSLAADRVQPVILCCATGKRSAQASDTLGYMGYKNIYDLGGILT